MLCITFFKFFIYFHWAVSVQTDLLGLLARHVSRSEDLNFRKDTILQFLIFVSLQKDTILKLTLYLGAIPEAIWRGLNYTHQLGLGGRCVQHWSQKVETCATSLSKTAVIQTHTRNLLVPSLTSIT